MSFTNARRRWFAISEEHPAAGELSREDWVRRLADEFVVLQCSCGASRRSS